MLLIQKPSRKITAGSNKLHFKTSSQGTLGSQRCRVDSHSMNFEQVLKTSTCLALDLFFVSTRKFVYIYVFAMALTWGLFLCLLESLFICMFSPWLFHYLSLCKAPKVAFALRVWFLFSKREILQIVLHFYFSLSCFLLGKQLFAWQKWMWSIGENERPFLLQRKLPFAFAKKKQNIWDKTTNISLFANPVKTWFFTSGENIFPHYSSHF